MCGRFNLFTKRTSSYIIFLDEEYLPPEAARSMSRRLECIRGARKVDSALPLAAISLKLDSLGRSNDDDIN
jgi:hypothetical protein